MSSDGLARMFAPRSVAVIGASPNRGKAGNALMRSLGTFPGSVHPVHPTAPEVLGRRAHPDVRAVREPVDLALIAVPAAAVPGAIAACGEARVGGAIVHAGGFAETGPEGRDLQLAAAEAAAAGGVRLLGPNTSGFIAPPTRLFATFVASTASVPAGPLAIVAQSGGVNHALAFAAQAEGLGVRLAVGLGNAADIGFPELLDHLAADEHVGAVVLAIEGVSDGRALVAAVEALVDRVPVVALKLGRSDVSEFARSHTGALTGSREVTRAVLRQAGAVVVDDTTALIDAARALATRRLRPKRRAGVGVVTGQAGPGLLLADALAVEGARMPTLPGAEQARLRELLGDLTYVRNPVDTGRPARTFADVLRTVASADDVDVLAVYLLDEPEAIDARELLGGSDDVGPLVLGTAGPPGDVVALRDDLARAGVTVMPTPERAAAAVAALIRDAAAAARRAAAAAPAPAVDTRPGLAEAEWDEARAKDLLERLGIPAPQRAVCQTHEDVLSAAARIGGPVVLKLLHPELTHKTEVGALRIGLTAPAEIGAALAELDAVELPSHGRYLVEAMAPAGPELLVGGVRDAAFGPVVMLGAGGTEVETSADVTTRLAPLAEDEAASMLDDLASAARFRGHRGGPVVDEAALARTITAIAATLCSRGDIAEIEVNPLRVTRQGLIALDALVVPAGSPTSADASRALDARRGVEQRQR